MVWWLGFPIYTLQNELDLVKSFFPNHPKPLLKGEVRKSTLDKTGHRNIGVPPLRRHDADLVTAGEWQEVGPLAPQGDAWPHEDVNSVHTVGGQNPETTFNTMVETSVLIGIVAGESNHSRVS